MSDLQVAVASLVLSVIVIVVTGVWRLGLVRDDLKAAIQAERKEIDKKLDDETERIREQFAETITAIRAKLTDVELYLRDNYVTKTTFNTVLERILAEMKGISQSFDNRCMRLETEIKSYLYEARRGNNEKEG